MDSDFLDILMSRPILLITVHEKADVMSHTTNSKRLSYLIESVLRYKKRSDVHKFFDALCEMNRLDIVRELKDV